MGLKIYDSVTPIYGEIIHSADLGRTWRVVRCKTEAVHKGRKKYQSNKESAGMNTKVNSTICIRKKNFVFYHHEKCIQWILIVGTYSIEYDFILFCAEVYLYLFIYIYM